MSTNPRRARRAAIEALAEAADAARGYTRLVKEAAVLRQQIRDISDRLTVLEDEIDLVEVAVAQSVTDVAAALDTGVAP